jgi:hypothetical protein
MLHKHKTLKGPTAPQQLIAAEVSVLSKGRKTSHLEALENGLAEAKESSASILDKV